MTDYYSDSGHLFGCIFHGRSLPDFVSNGVENQKVASLDAGAFADPGNRKFPINTPADTYISAAYLAKQAGALKQDDPLWDKILKTASIFGIEADVREIAAYASALETAAPEPPKVAAFKVRIGTPEEFVLEGAGAEAVQKIAAWIEQRHRTLRYGELKVAAVELVKAARENDTQVSGFFHRLAGDLGNDAVLINDQKLARLMLVDTLERKTASAELESIASVDDLRQFDDNRKLARLYGNQLLHPMDVFHTVPKETKTASAEDKFKTDLVVNGPGGIAFQATEAAFGKEAAQEALKGGAVDLSATSLIHRYIAGRL